MDTHNFRIDLHSHTTDSDGKDSIETLAQKAKDAGLSLLTITDHDRVNRAGRKLLEEKNILSLDAVEISVKDYERDHSFHLLYYAREISRRTDDILTGIREGRIRKIHGQCEKLAKHGFQISYELLTEFAAKDNIAEDCLNNGILATYLLESPGGIEVASKLAGRRIGTIQEVIDAFLKETSDFPEIGYVKVDDYEISIEQAVEIKNRDGGVLSIAHPNFSFAKHGGLIGFGEAMRKYRAMGVDGMEYNSLSTKEWIILTKRIAEETDAILTFGSDYHGDGNERHVGLGDLHPSLQDEEWQRLLASHTQKFLERVFTIVPKEELKKAFV